MSTNIEAYVLDLPIDLPEFYKFFNIQIKIDGGVTSVTSFGIVIFKTYVRFFGNKCYAAYLAIDGRVYTNAGCFEYTPAKCFLGGNAKEFNKLLREKNMDEFHRYLVRLSAAFPMLAPVRNKIVGIHGPMRALPMPIRNEIYNYLYV